MRQNAFSFFHSRFEVALRVQLRGFQNHGVTEIKAQAPLERAGLGCVRHGSRRRRLAALRNRQPRRNRELVSRTSLARSPCADVQGVITRRTSLAGYLNIVRSVGLGNE